MTLWLALRFPQLMIDALNSTAQQQPLAVVEQHRVLAINASAAALGIGCGMAVASALALCDSLQIQQRHPPAEQRWLAQQARPLTRFTPMVCCDDDCLLLEIGASLRLFRGLDPLLAALQQQLPIGPTCQLGLGLTPIAAQLLSAAGLAACRACIDPDGIDPDSITPEQPQPDWPASRLRLQALLASQPIAQLPLEAALIQRLQGPGFRTLGDLLTLPRAALRRRFGARFAQWLARLQGEQADLRQPLTVPQRFSSSLSFDQPLTHSQHLQPVMQQLLNEMADWLRRHQQQVRAIRWLLLPQRGPGTTLLVRRASSDYQAHIWFDLSCRQLTQLQLAQPVLSLRLDSGRLLPMSAPPAHLFAALERPGESELLAKLGNLPGLTLYRPSAVDSHLPEQSECDGDPFSDNPTVSSPAPLKDAPLWLLQRPRALRTRHQLPLWRGSPLTLLPAVEYCDEPWWQQEQQGLNKQRRYCIASHPLGVYCWLFHYRDQPDQWFLHGFF